MHRQPLFDVRDPERLFGLIRDHGLGTFILQMPDRPYVDHLPFVLTIPEGGCVRLSTHAARANPVWEAVPDGIECTVVFTGPDAYISPSWYPSRRQHGRVQPSWYYSVVHAYGRLRMVRDEQVLGEGIRTMTDYFERDRVDAWQVDEAPTNFIDALVHHIIGLEIELTGIVGKWQVGQQRNQADRLGIVEALRRETVASGSKLADQMLAAAPRR